MNMDWKYSIEFNKVIREVEDLEFPEQRRILVESLMKQAETLPNEHGHWLRAAFQDFATCIGECEDIEEVDGILEEMYDFADEENVWLGL